MSTKNLSLEHYNRMIEWVKKQDPFLNTNWFKMEDELGESWSGKYCMYCQKNKFICEDCELGVKGEHSRSCCGGEHHKMMNSLIWEEWLRHAFKVMEYIKEFGDERKI